MSQSFHSDLINSIGATPVRFIRVHVSEDRLRPCKMPCEPGRIGFVNWQRPPILVASPCDHQNPEFLFARKSATCARTRPATPFCGCMLRPLIPLRGVGWLFDNRRSHAAAKNARSCLNRPFRQAPTTATVDVSLRVQVAATGEKSILTIRTREVIDNKRSEPGINPPNCAFFVQNSAKK